MLKKLLTLIILLPGMAHAQFNYDLTISNETYTPLTSTISINKDTLWDDEVYKIGIGFPFSMNGSNIDSIGLVGPTLFLTDTCGITSGFWALATDMFDRGTYNAGNSLSPIRYKIEGSTEHRIFKAEIANAGLGGEYAAHGTYNDSLYLQLWLYETSNIVEMRFGPSNISYYNDEFIYSDGHPLIGYLHKVDLGNTTQQLCKQFYYYKGDPLKPVFDSTGILTAGTFMSDGLDAVPPKGTIYRFTPKPTSVKDANSLLNNVQVYPTICSNELFIDNNMDDVQVNYTVYHINGSKTTISGRQILRHERIDVSVLPSGFYILKLSGNSNSNTYKFTKL